MTYSQWVTVNVVNLLATPDLSIADAAVEWGKFHENGQPEVELSSAAVEEVKIAPGTMESISSCGREAALSGTFGWFSLYDGATQLCTITFDCPWGSKANRVSIGNKSTDHEIILDDYNRYDGPLGDIYVTVAKKP
ncbi:hypothetical protein HIM_03603 [Hirsutella minnesotensis 3608]|uniref:Aegerolysin Aa-Pri1 n=1 Tax=Hirsutella minnesotensis 3608 TaxID=1043627 RepID=A0A0F8A2U4_9HYPO|nr:hypothetical protein HIM_03603 [Hirsutella minnesotensis 3608]